MKLETLQHEKFAALKSGDKMRTNIITDIIGNVKRAAIDKNCRDNIPESMVDEVLLKYQKMVQEQIDTCPAGRVEALAEYKRQMEIVAEFAPILIADEEEIRRLILDVVNGEVEFSKANRGKIMKIIVPVLKGKADMSVVNTVIGKLLQ